ncbi:MAG: hypothetical protein ABSB25_07515 [Sedimentisphaerales bacterium]
MRKLLVLVFVAVFVAMMCVPSYGNSTLVYKTSQKTSDFSTDALVKQTLAGYLVLSVNLDTQDVCDAQQLTYWLKPTPNQQAVNVTVDFAAKGGYIVADYVSGTKDAVLAGKYTDGKTVGLTGKNIAKTLNGSMLVGELGLGTMSMTLDVAKTKADSTSDVPTVIGLIQNSLAAKYPIISDTTKPTPNPMTWASVPAALSDTAITMTATTATDAGSPPVLYYFANVTDTSHHSGWILTPTWIDTGLTADTNYTYTVTAEDSAAVPNVTDASASASATTHFSADTNAPTPNPMTWASGPNATSDTQITMTATTATDPQGPVKYYFRNKQDPNGHNSGWTTSTTFTDTNLAPNTRYDYNVMAEDNASTPNKTAASVDMNATTKTDTTAPTPNPMTFAVLPHATGATSISMKATTAVDNNVGSVVQYRFRNSASLGVLRDWSTDANFTDTGLSESTIHSYQVQAEDVCNNATAWSAAAQAQTSASLKTQINLAIFADPNRASTAVNYAPLTITIADGCYVEDVEINEPNITLQSTTGSAAATIQPIGVDPNGIKLTSRGAVLATGCTIGGAAGKGFAIKSAVGASTVALISADKDNTTVSYCDLNSAGDASMGVRIDKANTVTIANNTFENDGNGVYLGPGFANGLTVATVRNISITSNTFTKLGTDANFVKIDSSDACSITISGNNANEGMAVVVGPNETNLINLNITNNTFTRGGILMYESADGCDANRLQSMTINLNTFSAGSQDYALVIDTSIEPNDVNWGGVSFTNNSLLRTPGGALPTVDNMIGTAGQPVSLSAKRNYWGDATGPIGVGAVLCGTTGSSTSTYVTFNPFWATATGTDANCPAP